MELKEFKEFKELSDFLYKELREPKVFKVLLVIKEL